MLNILPSVLLKLVELYEKSKETSKAALADNIPIETNQVNLVIITQ